MKHSRDNLRPLFDSVLVFTPALLEIIKRSHVYSRRYLPKLPHH